MSKEELSFHFTYLEKQLQASLETFSGQQAKEHLWETFGISKEHTIIFYWLAEFMTEIWQLALFVPVTCELVGGF